MHILINILIVTAVVAAITVLYKLMPCRSMGARKPLFALLPKYKRQISLKLNDQELESKLSEFGFQKTDSSSSILRFHRGHILGDLSIKLAKVKIGIQKLDEENAEITLQAGWVALFDTGDHWKLISELGDKLQE